MTTETTSTDDAERDEIARIARETLSRNGLMPDRWHRVADAILAAGFRRAPAPEWDALAPIHSADDLDRHHAEHHHREMALRSDRDQARAEADALRKALGEIVKMTGHWGGTQGAIRDVAKEVLAAHPAASATTTEDVVTMTEESVYDHKPEEFAKMVRDARSHPAPQPAREEALRELAQLDQDMLTDRDEIAKLRAENALLRQRYAELAAASKGLSDAAARLASPPTAAAGVTEVQIDAALREIDPTWPESRENMKRALAAAQMRTGE